MMIKLHPELDGEFSVHIIDMPIQSRGFVLYDADDHASIYLNARYSRDAQRKAAAHELRHILNDDIHSAEDIRAIEARADGPNAAHALPRLFKARDLLPKPSPLLEGAPTKADEVTSPTSRPVTKHRQNKPVPITPHQAAVLLRALADLDGLLFTDSYEY